jgi:hypothetical protein
VSPLSNLGTLPPLHPMVVGMMGWEGRRTFVEIPVVTKVLGGYEFVSAFG